MTAAWICALRGSGSRRNHGIYAKRFPTVQQQLENLGITRLRTRFRIEGGEAVRGTASCAAFRFDTQYTAYRKISAHTEPYRLQPSLLQLSR